MSEDESSKKRKASTPVRSPAPLSAPNSPRPEHEDHIIDDEYWTDGDFEIITANGVRFRVPSYHLFAAS